MKMMKKYEFYVASGWFNEKQANDLKNIKETLDKHNICYFSPKDELLCDSNANIDFQSFVFKNNLKAIKKAKCVIVNTRDKDLGTIFEAGFAFAVKKPIIYFYEGLQGNFNLMLSQSGIAVATSILELEQHVLGFLKDNTYKVAYEGKIE